MMAAPAAPHHERGIRVPDQRVVQVDALDGRIRARRAEAGSRAAGLAWSGRGVAANCGAVGNGIEAVHASSVYRSRRPRTRGSVQTFRAPTRMESLSRPAKGAPLMGAPLIAWSGSTRDGRSQHVVSDISRHALGHAVRLRSIRWLDGRRELRKPPAVQPAAAAGPRVPAARPGPGTSGTEDSTWNAKLQAAASSPLYRTETSR